MVDLLYSALRLERPRDPDMRLPLLRYRLTDRVYRLQLRDVVPQVAAALGCSQQIAKREIRKNNWKWT